MKKPYKVEQIDGRFYVVLHGQESVFDSDDELIANRYCHHCNS